MKANIAGYSKICVVGLGYVGLPTALLFAKHGFDVQGVDVSPNVLSTLENDTVEEIHPELSDWWRSVKDDGAFRAGPMPEESDVFLITVPTPIHSVSRTCDLTAVIAATKSILPVLRPGNAVVLESTVAPGTTRQVLKPLIESIGLRVGEDIHLCFSPERILPGNTIHELVNNHRILGGVTRDSAMRVKSVFQLVVKGEIFITDDLTAEFCKVAENTFRDVNIALANELSLVADQLGVDMREAIPLINQHPRVNLLQPGIGVGGHCIAVDPWFLVEAAPDRTPLISTARAVNDGMPAHCAEKIIADVAHLSNPVLCLVGLTYKPDVTDTRESPAGEIVRILRDKGYEVVTYDPMLAEYQEKSLYDYLSAADYLGVLVNHSVVKAELALNREKILGMMRTPVLRVF